MMRATSLFVMLAMVAAVSEATADEEIPAVKGTADRPAIAVWREDWGLAAPSLGPFVVTAIWSDGRVVWSRDNLQGGPPYYEGKVDRKAVDAVLREIEARKAFSAPYVRENNFGPDSFCTGVFLARGDKTLVTRSWHELAERNPNIVAASHGLTSLQDVSREEYLKKDKKDYQQYRALWSYIRERVATLTPKKGEKKTLEFEFIRVSTPENAKTQAALARRGSPPAGKAL